MNDQPAFLLHEPFSEAYGPMTFTEDIVGQYVIVATRSGMNYRGWVTDVTCDLLAIELDSHPGYLFDGSDVLRLNVAL